MRLADRIASTRLGIPTLSLMERAGEAVARCVRRTCRGPAGALVFCGPGNNGGDGLVAARLLSRWGWRVQIMAPSLDFRGDALTNYQRAVEAGLEILVTEERGLPPFPVVIDALLGTGLRGAVRDPYTHFIREINRLGSKATVISVDVPSGMDSDTGEALSESVKADLTVTLGRPKLGLVLPQARSLTGKMILDTLGIPDQAVEEAGCRLRLTTPGHLKRRLNPVDPGVHKGDMGHVLIVGGSPRYQGAACLAAMGALRSGAGLVSVASISRDLPLPPEAMKVCLSSLRSRRLDLSAWIRLREWDSRIDSWVLGPGLGQGPGERHLVWSCLAEARKRGVLDADALNALSGDLKRVGRLRERFAGDSWILTPHPGEMARLLESSVEGIQKDRLSAAREAALATGQVVVLKGAGTISVGPEGDGWINPTGGPLLASGGTGDVLAGTAGALLARGLGSLEAASASAFVHGLSADILARDGWGQGAGAMRVAEAIPRVIPLISEGGPLHMPDDHLLTMMEEGREP